MEDLMSKIQEVLSDEESMKQINELAQMFSSGSQSENSDDINGQSDNSSGLGFDMSKLLLIQNAMSSVGSDKNAELLLALRPLLREEKQAKVDKAVKLLKLYAVWNVLKDSGLLKDLL